MKKLWSLIIAFCLVLSIVPMGVFSITASAEIANDGFEYEISGGEVTITGYTGNATRLVIPSNFNGCPVTQIGDYAFYGFDELTSIKIPEGVTSIGECVFYTCTNLTSVTIPNSVTSIGMGAFYYCTKLESFKFPDSLISIGEGAFFCCTSLTSITLPNGVKNIDEGAFLGCTGAKTLTIPNSITSIENGVFYWLESLESVIIPDSVTSIGDEAFYLCQNLKSVTMGNNVTSIGKDAFDWCYSLGKVIVPKNVTNIGANAFDVSTLLYGYKTCSALVEYVNTYDNDFVYLDGTAAESIVNGKIGRYTWSLDKRNGGFVIVGNGQMADFNDVESPWYSYRKFITKVTVSDGITKIGQNAFSDLCNLEEVSLPNTLTSISDWAFYNCTSLTKVTLPNNVTSIGMGAFEYCTNLKSISIPNNLTNIDSYAFSQCTNLKSITIPDGVINIGRAAFLDCSSLKEITVPVGVNVIYDTTFGFCNSLEKVEIYNKSCYIYSECGLNYKQTIYGFEDSTAETFAEKIGAEFIDVMTIHSHKYTDANDYTCDKCGFMKASIMRQPTSVNVTSGSDATVTVRAVGEGLTYKWYYKEKGGNAFTLTKSFTGDTYSVEMNSTRAGRQVYCVVTDKEGNKATSDIVTLNMKTVAKITKQPTSVNVINGSDAKVTVSAVGDGLTYKWYYKNKDASNFTLTTSITGNTYLTVMNSTRAGRQIYCVVTDKYGNSVKSNTVTLNLKTVAKIIKQPANVSVTNGSTAKVTLTAVGDGLTYKWYYKEKGGSAFALTTSFTSNTYSVAMTLARAGRQVYCVVTDKYGNKVKSNTVTLNMTKTVAKITKQPANVSVTNASTAKVTLTAVGDGLTYKWYYKEKGGKAFALTNSFKGNTYSVVMNSTRAGRQIYCVVTDMYGNKVKSNTVTLNMKIVAKITKQPTSVTAKKGANAKFTVTAVGDGLKYQWQVRTSSTAWKNTTITGCTTKTITVPVTAARNKYQYRCIITDKYGNKVTSGTATLYIK